MIPYVHGSMSCSLVSSRSETNESMELFTCTYMHRLAVDQGLFASEASHTSFDVFLFECGGWQS